MDIRAVAFDVNGTLIKILTEEGTEEIFRSVAHFLTYQGIDLHRDQIRDLYFRIMKEQLRASPEEYPEVDAAGIWRGIIDEHMTDFTRALPAGKLRQMPLFLTPHVEIHLLHIVTRALTLGIVGRGIELRIRRR